MSLLNPDSTPQFGTAEYKGQPNLDRCKGCGQPIMGSYYRVGSNLACPSCADRLKREVPQDSHDAFVRALVFGVAAAIVALILYATLTILLEGVQIGYMSLGVGWLVAKAMMKGSNGIGGRRYQIVAAALTYAVVSMAIIPVGIYFYLRDDAKLHKPAVVQQQSSGSDNQSGDQQQGPNKTNPSLSFADLMTVLGRLALRGLMSPFYVVQRSAFGFVFLLILAIGIRIAWRMTAGTNEIAIYGPYEASQSASV